MDISAIKKQLRAFREEGKRVFATSSFQTQSVPLLHILSRVDRDIPVYFLNTGYLFPETIRFKDRIRDDFGLNIIPLYPTVPKSQQKDRNGTLLFLTDPDYCCYLNKTQPMEPILAGHDIWISGVRGDQNATREQMGTFEEAPFNCTRYHPVLGWTEKMIYRYIKEHGLPKHPLEESGYMSIGCEPCTRKITGDGRDGRWFGMNKTECGLHTELVKK